MLSVTEIKGNKIKYECDCGALGECLFLPPKISSIVILDLRCPMCGDVERLNIEKQDGADKDSKQMAWGLVLDNRLLGE